MPKKKRQETPEEQSERFQRDAQAMIDAGELSPTEAESVLDKLIRKTSLSARKEPKAHN
jgi:polyhydroxyalkanoate synthesis regulator phasin